MPTGSSYFWRSFLSSPEDEEDDTVLSARVGPPDSSFLSAWLSLGSPSENEMGALRLFAMNEEDVDLVVKRASKLATVVADWYKALESTAKEVKKNIRKEEQEK